MVLGRVFFPPCLLNIFGPVEVRFGVGITYFAMVNLGSAGIAFRAIVAIQPPLTNKKAQGFFNYIYFF